MATSQISFDSALSAQDESASSEPALSGSTRNEDVIEVIQNSKRFEQSSTLCFLPLVHPAVQEQATTNEVTQVRRRPIPRKGHTKSRRGCFGCKRKKIKCQETRPKCGNCQKTGMLCEYPTSMFDLPTTRPITQPQSTPTVFSITDMRFFHHFLVRGYPHLPPKGDSIWTLQIPAYAYEVNAVRQSVISFAHFDLV